VERGSGRWLDRVLASDAPGQSGNGGWLLHLCGRSTAHIAGLFHPALEKAGAASPLKEVQV